MTKLIFVINELIVGKFTGVVEISFFKGGIAKVKKKVCEEVEL